MRGEGCRSKRPLSLIHILNMKSLYFGAKLMPHLNKKLLCRFMCCFCPYLNVDSTRFEKHNNYHLLLWKTMANLNEDWGRTSILFIFAKFQHFLRIFGDNSIFLDIRRRKELFHHTFRLRFRFLITVIRLLFTPP